MSIVLPALAVAFAAFCVKWGVKIVNRDEDWIHATWIYGGGAIAISAAIAAAALAAICLHYFIHS
jgi:hypothetical protein